MQRSAAYRKKRKIRAMARLRRERESRTLSLAETLYLSCSTGGDKPRAEIRLLAIAPKSIGSAKKQPAQAGPVGKPPFSRHATLS